MEKFAIDGLYFMIRYDDAEKKYMSIDSMVFIGLNIEYKEGDRDAWYFQDSYSYCEQGPLVGRIESDKLNKYPNSSNDHQWKKPLSPDIYILHEEDIYLMLNTIELSKELSECFFRRNSSGIEN